MDDFFHLDAPAYAQRMSQTSDVELKRREVAKMRIFLAGSCALGSGVGALPFTGGLSLMACGYSGRRMNVAMRKLNIIQAELARRKIKLHTLTGKDKTIAVVSGLLALGTGSMVGIEEATAGDAVIPLDATQQPAPATEDVGHLEPFLEQHAASELASAASFWVMEWFEDPVWREEMKKALCCSRLFGCLSLLCNECGDSITQAKYAHCCECDDDEYDLCLKCYQSDISCPGKDHALTVRQLAVFGSLCNSDKAQALQRQKHKRIRCDRCQVSIRQGRFYACMVCNKDEGGFDLCVNCYHQGQVCNEPETHCLYTFLKAYHLENTSPYSSNRGIAGEVTVRCDKCEKKVRQGGYYHCDDCVNGNFDLCHSCYELGESCLDSGHILKVYYAYDTFIRQSSLYGYSNGRPKCDICGETVRSVCYYHCRKCGNGNFDLCDSCYRIGAGCKNRSHILAKVQTGK